MEWLKSLLFDGGIAHDVLTFALVITCGLAPGKIKIGGVSLGITWILFAGIFFSHFGMRVDQQVLNFIKEFGMILFVFSIGLQVGPAFFASFKQGGLQLIACAAVVVLLGVTTTYIVHLVTGTPLTTMIGVMSGAVTSTPGLGAAQQTYADATGMGDESIAMGYALTYPLGVVGVILALIALRALLHIDPKKEDQGLIDLSQANRTAEKISIEFTNATISGRKIARIRALIDRQFVISRILHADGRITIADAGTTVELGDKLLIITQHTDVEAVEAFFGHRVEMDDTAWGVAETNVPLVARRILITRSSINGKTFADLRLRTRYGITITRVNRAGVDLVPYQGLELQVGDRVLVVGPEQAVMRVADLLGNSLKTLDTPNLITIFVGVALGVLLGSLPLLHIPQPVKLGLAGGPLIVAILIGRFGTRFGLITYTTMSANLMLREVGIALFLASVGIGAGEGFVDAIVAGGYRWIGYGFIITVVPLLVVGLMARRWLRMNFYTLSGMLAGSMTDSPALAYATTSAGNDMPSVSYSTVYPAVVFLRVLAAQLLVLFAL